MLVPGGFRCWADKGLYTLNQLFSGKDLKSFSQLQKQFSLPSTDLHRYFQIRHYIMTHKEKEMICKMPNAIEEYLINILEKGFPTRKREMRDKYLQKTWGPQNTLYIKEKWELELNIIIEHDVCSIWFHPFLFFLLLLCNGSDTIALCISVLFSLFHISSFFNALKGMTLCCFYSKILWKFK